VPRLPFGRALDSRARGRFVSSRQAGNDGDEFGRFDGLGQMHLVARMNRANPIFRPREGGQRDRRRPNTLGAHDSHELVTTLDRRAVRGVSIYSSWSLSGHRAEWIGNSSPMGDDGGPRTLANDRQGDRQRTKSIKAARDSIEKRPVRGILRLSCKAGIRFASRSKSKQFLSTHSLEQGHREFNRKARYLWSINKRSKAIGMS
jgi:hypothetical protein